LEDVQYLDWKTQRTALVIIGHFLVLSSAAQESFNKVNQEAIPTQLSKWGKGQLALEI
jgi:hypothetical protein